MSEEEFENKFMNLEPYEIMELISKYVELYIVDTLDYACISDPSSKQRVMIKLLSILDK